MTARSKHAAVLTGQVAAVFTIQYVMAARAHGHQDDGAPSRRRSVWMHAVASEVVTFLIDELIRQRHRAEVALDRAVATSSMPAAVQPDAKMRLPRQPSRTQSAVLPGA